jgi:hypothetical protein
MVTLSSRTRHPNADTHARSPRGESPPDGSRLPRIFRAGTLTVIMVARFKDSAIQQSRESKRAAKFARARRVARGAALVLFASVAPQCEHKTFDLLPVPGEETGGSAGAAAGSSAGAGTHSGGSGGASGSGGTAPGSAGSGGTGGGGTGGASGASGRGFGGGFPVGGHPSGGYSSGGALCQSEPNPQICTGFNCDWCEEPYEGCARCEDNSCVCTKDADCLEGKVCDPTTRRCLKRCEFGQSSPQPGCPICRVLAPSLSHGVCANCFVGFPCGPDDDWFCDYGVCIQCREDCDCARAGGKCVKGFCRCERDEDCRRSPDEQGRQCEFGECERKP